VKMRTAVIRAALVAAARGCAAVCGRLPFAIASVAGAVIGTAAYYLLPVARGAALRHIRAAFPEKTTRETARIVRESFSCQGRNLFELFTFRRLDRVMVDRYVSFPDRYRLEAAFAQGNGVIIISGHLGNWELLGAALSRWGYPVNVIARAIYLKGLDDLLVSLRAAVGMTVIPRAADGSPRAILRALRQNQIIGILIDQDIKVPGVFCDFFGKPAFTATGPAAIALRSNAAVVTGALVRSGCRHRLVINGPHTFEQTGDRQRDIAAMTARMTGIIEASIREHPAQWVWMHERWKTKHAG